MTGLFRSLLSGVVVLSLAGCVQVYPPQPQPSPVAGASGDSSKAEEKKAPFKPWKEVLKDTREIPGFFTTHLKRDNTLFLELKPVQLEKDFALVMHYSRGLGDFNVFDGLPLSETRLLRFQRAGDQLYLVHVNPRFTADSGSPMLRSVERNTGNSIIQAFKIQSENDETKNVLVDLTDFVVSDYANVADLLKPYYGNKSVSFDKNRSYVGKVMGFPKNLEIDAELTFQASDPPTVGGEGVSDYRSIPVGVRYSVFALPDTAMRPRYADDRVGHFLDAVEDFSRDRKETPYLRYVNRWRLEKKDPSATLSEPVQPIMYYIDHSVPLEYRRYVREGIEAWNKAFEAAGFKNAIVARDAPADSTWSAEDMRYSTVQWTAAHRMGYAIGPSETDPRTGEILNADVLISSEFVRAWLFEYQELADPAGMVQRYREFIDQQRQLPPQLAQRVCLAEFGKRHQLSVEYALLVGLGVIDGGKPLPESYLGDAIRDLVMHEVGHTLGLRHNFKASSGIPYQRLQDTAFTQANGVTLSVMDYGPVNIALDRRQQGDYWNKEVGTYDVWAIQYAYAPIYQQPPDGPFAMSGTPVASAADELPGLQKLARRGAESLHTYGTDEDNWLGAFAVDPLTNAWDLGSEPARYARDRVTLIRTVQPNLEGRLIEPGEGYQRLRGAVTSLLFDRFLALLPVTKTVGGLYVTRDHKDDPDARAPFTPVPAAQQREAVQLLVTDAFSEDAFQFDPGLLNKLAPSRWAHWGVPWFTVPVDYPIHSWVALVQLVLLDELLSSPRLARMIDNEVRVPAGTEAYPLSELFGTLTSAIWSELGDSPARVRPIGSFRRNLQRGYLQELTNLLLPRLVGAPEDARSLARLELTRLSQRMGAVLSSGAVIDTATRAHLAESEAGIDRALEAAVVIPVR